MVDRLEKMLKRHAELTAILERDRAIIDAVPRWLEKPMPLIELLREHDVRDLSWYARFSPEDVIVYRGAFRAADAIRELGLDITPQKFSKIVRAVPRWMRPVTANRFGQLGRWWIKRGSNEYGWATTPASVDLQTPQDEMAEDIARLV